MCKETTAIRLKKIMDERNLRQADVLELTKPYCEKYHVKMNRSDLSQYCTGKVEPHQEKLFVLGSALDVSEAWLMGFDVPKERKTQDSADHFTAVALAYNEKRHEKIISMNLNDSELEIIEKYRYLDEHGKDMIDMILSKEYNRCVEEEENTTVLTAEEIKSLPLGSRMKLIPFVGDDLQLRIARKRNKRRE